MVEFFEPTQVSLKAFTVQTMGSKASGPPRGEDTAAYSYPPLTGKADLTCTANPLRNKKHQVPTIAAGLLSRVQFIKYDLVEETEILAGLE